MKYIKITNTGEIEPQALHLVGASTKRNDASKIGQFGSGNKYALAYLMRNNYDIQIFSGLNQISIDTKPETFRENIFNVIHINGEKTSITTEMGKDWQLWQAIRELYCNAIDEGGYRIDFVQTIEPSEGVTQFYIENKGEVMEFMIRFDDYFAVNKKVLFESPAGRILQKTGSSANIYRKGIRCFHTTKTSSFDYDLTNVDINEDRIAKYFWEVERSVWELIFQCTNKEVIRQILIDCGGDNTLEGNLSDYTTISTIEPSKEFNEVVSSLKIAPKGLSGLLETEELGNTVVIPTKIFQSVRGGLSDDNVASKFKLTSNSHLYVVIENHTPLQKETLRKAMDFLKEVDFDIPYAIEIARFDNKEVLGAAHEKRILVSDICMEKGVTEVVNTIIEEFIHLKYGVKDETRAFQTATITEFISYMQKTNSYAI